MEEEDNVFCGSVMPLCLMKEIAVFEEQQKFGLVVYDLNIVCVFFFFLMKILCVLLVNFIAP